MPGLLMDDELGDIILDELNNTIQVTDHYAFRQILIGLFHCIPGSEMLHPFYGFPLNIAIRESGQKDSEMFIESLIVEALDPKKEKLIKSLDNIQSSRVGNDLHVSLVVSSIIDNVVTSELDFSTTKLIT